METVVSTQSTISVCTVNPVSPVSPVPTRTPSQVARRERRKSRRLLLQSSLLTECYTCKQFGCKTPATILDSEGQYNPCSMKHTNQTVCQGYQCTNVAYISTSKNPRSYCKTCIRKYTLRPGYCLICQSIQGDNHGHCYTHRKEVLCELCGKCYLCHGSC